MRTQVGGGSVQSQVAVVRLALQKTDMLLTVHRSHLAQAGAPRAASCCSQRVGYCPPSVATFADGSVAMDPDEAGPAAESDAQLLRATLQAPLSPWRIAAPR